VRAEELIVEIYRQRSELAGQGQNPGRVVMSAVHYRLIQEYRTRLGELSSQNSDYLDPYRVFDLEICVEEITLPKVEVAERGADDIGAEQGEQGLGQHE
jgi:hypothetical protein